MSNDNDNEVELSPGFFDLNNPNSNNDISEISNLIPEKINVENNNTNNVIVEFFTLMILNYLLLQVSFLLYNLHMAPVICIGQKIVWVRSV